VLVTESEREPSDSLSEKQHERLAAIRSSETLAGLQALTGADSEHDAYLQAKAEWSYLRERALGAPTVSGLPGDTVVVEGQPIRVHGITHADTDAERSFLRRHLRPKVEDGEAVYCEQGIRRMYFTDFSAVCETDDYRWAMHQCRERDIDSHIEGQLARSFETEHEGPDLRSIAGRFREVTFSLIDSGSEVYGDRFASALGDIASDFLMSHSELATGEDFASFKRSRAAANDPDRLVDLQRYYKCAFLPQPVEREWLRRHEPELEIFTHARNERIAAHVLAHASGTDPVHILTGAAHQPGITYYLRAYRDDDWGFEPFEPVP
jgi:hypothetical protein